ncbi:MAG: hypothetical protein ACYTGV_00405, partial [Planctomycetota bacterium]
MRCLLAATVLGCAVALSSSGCSTGENPSARLQVEVDRLEAKIDTLREELTQARDDLRRISAGQEEIRVRLAEQRALIESLLFPPDGPPEPVPPPRREPPIRQSRWDPPADLPHLESTPAELRQRIDEQIEIMFDPDAGRESLEAKEA